MRIDITGRRFERLLVIKDCGRDKWGDIYGKGKGI